ncbi:Crp/Fnr family transcriptional regulator [Acidisphaera sp. L21]|uniref:Crp/Fnr family transcriptional regulator n=1 Tax=Acidisphaera sp. L21 TaxID=1641851 RepID=UPI001C203F93|nr:Crp/Fnr family transcriptional regulator [Acidisphaera sp. L21]
MLVLDMKPHDVIQRAGDDVLDTWFPCASAMASFCVTTNPGGHGIEVAVVGREGAVGGIVSNGNLPSFSTALVRSGGRFLRIKTSALEHAKLDSIHLRHWFARYSDCLLAQVYQTAACNATHTITQRTAKWLLATVRRTEGSEFDMTQEQLADLLGVGRTFVTRTIKTLRERRMVATRRGKFQVLDEAALRDLTCGCTAAIEDHFDKVLHGIYPAE